MNNLNGTSRPNVTNGPQGIYALPELNLFGYDFGQPHQILGHTFGKFANYYVFLVALLGVVVFIFARVNDSRIGRAWIAIREDETAADRRRHGAAVATRSNRDTSVRAGRGPRHRDTRSTTPSVRRSRHNTGRSPSLDHSFLVGHLITSGGWTTTVSRTHRDRAA